MRRNIVNIDQIELFIDNINKRYDDKTFESFIKGNLRNYIVRKAPIKENSFFWLKKFSKKTSPIHKKILSKGGPYHVVLLNEELSAKVNEIMDFLYGHKEDYIGKQNIIIEDIMQKHLSWIKQINKTVTTEEGTVEICAEFKDKYTIVKLIDQQAYTREGSLMHHCVATYANRASSTIYSLRDPNNKPLVTFERQKDLITQVSAISNSRIPKELKKYVNDFAKTNKLKFGTNYVGGPSLHQQILPLAVHLFIAFKWQMIINLLFESDKKSHISELLKNGTVSNAITFCFVLLACNSLFEFMGNLHMGGSFNNNPTDEL
jgi:hypothetical protein